jgi:prephenate dehydrogenase
MAGREKTGIENAEAGLFQGAVCAVCPTQRTDGDALETVKRLWTAVGARVLPIGAGLHDRIVARTSHLPHLVAAVLTGTAGEILSGEELALEFIASGFLDTTRIAAGDPVMWRDICRDNRREILSSISEFKEQLERIEEWVREGKTEEISRELARVQRIRQEIGNNRKP